jgi:putative heme-binding domain-containing protein
LLEEAPPAGIAEKLVWLRQHSAESLEGEWARLERGEVQVVTAAERIATLEALASAPPRSVPARFLASALNDSDGRVQQAALRALRSTGSERSEFCAPTLQLAKSAKSNSLRLEAIWTLGALRNGGAPEDWLGFIENSATRPAAIRALRQRDNSPPVREALLSQARLIEEQSQDAAEDLLFTMHALGVSSNQCRSAGLELPPRDKRTFAEAVLRRVPTGSPVLGRLSFHSARVSCSKCHATRPDEASFGPNLSNIGAASQPEYLVESILEPSKVIKTGFETERIDMVDGQSLSGLVEVRDKGLVIRVSAEERIALPREKILCRTVGAVSSMPEGLDAACSTAELADIVAYLMSLRTDAAVANQH